MNRGAAVQANDPRWRVAVLLQRFAVGGKGLGGKPLDNVMRNCRALMHYNNTGRRALRRIRLLSALQSDVPTPLVVSELRSLTAQRFKFGAEREVEPILKRLVVCWVCIAGWEGAMVMLLCAWVNI